MSKQPEKVGKVEVRFLKDGNVDEVIIHSGDEKVSFHLEKMDNNYFWARVRTGKEKDLVLSFKATKNGKAIITHEWTDTNEQQSQG